MGDENTVTAIADNIDAAVEQPAPKKRPGRPRKVTINTPSEFRGVITEPYDKTNLVELVYWNPRMFKKIYTIHKNYAVNEVKIIFEADRAMFVARDHLGKSRIVASIIGNNLNSYYCKEPISIWVKRNPLGEIFNTLDKNHCKITFALKDDFRSRFYIYIHDLEYDSIDNYTVEVICKPGDDDILAGCDPTINYPLKFKLGSKYFKRRVSDISKSSKTLTIQKNGEGPLQLTFEKEKGKQIEYNGVYVNSGKISLNSSIPNDDILSVSVIVNYIKPFSNSNVGDEVELAIDRKEKLCLTTWLDKSSGGYAVEIKVFTEIKAC